jgi:hypothetical protein
VAAARAISSSTAVGDNNGDFDDADDGDNSDDNDDDDDDDFADLVFDCDANNGGDVSDADKKGDAGAVAA